MFDVNYLSPELCPVGDTSLNGIRCQTSFGDGVCDSSCDNEQSQYDGFDCCPSSSTSTGLRTRSSHYDRQRSPVTSSSSSSSRYQCSTASSAAAADISDNSLEMRCRRSYADGVCDNECYNAACLWDGGDCATRALRFTSYVQYNIFTIQFY